MSSCVPVFWTPESWILIFNTWFISNGDKFIFTLAARCTQQLNSYWINCPAQDYRHSYLYSNALYWMSMLHAQCTIRQLILSWHDDEISHQQTRREEKKKENTRSELQSNSKMDFFSCFWIRYGRKIHNHTMYFRLMCLPPQNTCNIKSNAYSAIRLDALCQVIFNYICACVCAMCDVRVWFICNYGSGTVGLYNSSTSYIQKAIIM